TLNGQLVAGDREALADLFGMSMEQVSGIRLQRLLLDKLFIAALQNPLQRLDRAEAQDLHRLKDRRLSSVVRPHEKVHPRERVDPQLAECAEALDREVRDHVAGF